VKFDEPFHRLLTQGMVLKGGEVMSKSKGNTVDPDAIIEKYGADSLRLCILFAAPPEDQLEWSDGAVEGSWKFLSRIWNLVEKRFRPVDDQVTDGDMDDQDKNLERDRNATIKKVTEDITKNYKFNTAISSMMILMNAIDRYKGEGNEDGRQAILNRAIRSMVLLMSPFTPHMCEELWQIMGGQEESISRVPWPSVNEDALKQDTIKIIAQVNGKLRGIFNVPTGITEKEIKEVVLADQKIQEFVSDKPIKKFIYIPHKLVNLVV